MDSEAKCPVVRDLLPSYIDELTSRETNEFVAAHLAECEACRAAYRVMARVQTPDEAARGDILSRLARARRRTRRAWALAIASALLLAAICALPLPRRIDVSAEALKWRCGDAEYEKTVAARVKGVYYDYLFRTDKFAGEIAVEGYAETEAPLSEARFENGVAWLYYQRDDGLLRAFGFMLLAPDGGEFAIGVYSNDGDGGGGWSGDDGVVITYPASSRAEAVDATNAIAKRLNPSWLGGGKPLE